MFGFMKKLTKLLPKEATLPGRKERMHVPERHFVNGSRIVPPFPDGMALAQFGMGCFWGAERVFWQTPGVYSTAVGYAGGDTPNPTYEEVCTGFTNHTEAVLVVFDPKQVSYEALLKKFWEGHDPTQGMRQGNDSRRRSGRGKRSRRRCARRAMDPLPPRSARRPSSTTPRTTTSNTSARTRTATAAWAGPA
jgi:peptide-methionine (S)-S-oxide reductase